jgi:glyceraldehyde 3-phosphate dehydrogenase
MVWQIHRNGFFKNQLLDKKSEIINLHQYAGDFVGKPITIFDSVEIAKVVLSLDLPPSKLDIIKLTTSMY